MYFVTGLYAPDLPNRVMTASLCVASLGMARPQISSETHLGQESFKDMGSEVSGPRGPVASGAFDQHRVPP